MALFRDKAFDFKIPRASTSSAFAGNAPVDSIETERDGNNEVGPDVGQGLYSTYK